MRLKRALKSVLKVLAVLRENHLRRRILRDIEARRVQLDADAKDLPSMLNEEQLRFLLMLRRKYPNHKPGSGSTDLTDEEFIEFMRIMFEQEDRKGMRN